MPLKVILNANTVSDDAIALLMTAGLTDFPVHAGADRPLLRQIAIGLSCECDRFLYLLTEVLSHLPSGKESDGDSSPAAG